ncbi:respirasome Complex Assembly Factor 1 [Aricia agestis]|uniref:respirasome Complex Assembly Factor 1 n=1 Tax=Aricia agestis TaxID=91739 RepID=UPI001C201E27|nr:respirasome Complex Assembly Factor 1 [Aricia agestis]
MANRAKVSETNNKDKVESTWVRAFRPSAEWPDKEEFLDVVYWIRQLLGIVLGLVWGLIPLKGFFGLFMFVSANAASLYVYVSNYQRVDEEEYGGMWEITKEGFVTSFAGFLVTWIIVYTGLHGQASL